MNVRGNEERRSTVIRLVLKYSIFTLAVIFACASAPRTPGVSQSAADLELIPHPTSARVTRECAFDAVVLDSALSYVPAAVAGAGELARERWKALGIAERPSGGTRIAFANDDAIARQGYALHVGSDGVRVRSSDEDGAFYALVTLAQLARRGGPGSWYVPCVDITDAPALRWRILSDDVSRGPLPTMKYFEERIRTIASFKMNGYSPYMEHVFVDPKNPLPAPLDGITPDQLHELDAYARRFHVAFVPADAA